jgi:hypothetical protein
MVPMEGQSTHYPPRSFAAQNWSRHLGVPEVSRWRPWTLDGRQETAGYVTRCARRRRVEAGAREGGA